MKHLQCYIQNYDWGKKGFLSDVAKIYAAGHDVEIADTKSYAELWMGTHPNGPAKLKNSATNLSRFIAIQGPNDGTYRREMHLPFIMKLMSIEKALSLQVHPTKEQAAELNSRDPIHYPDRNHKPELAYAWKRFELLCGFRPADQISMNISAFPELKMLMGDEPTEAFIALVNAGISCECEAMKADLAVCFRNFISTKDSLKIMRLIESTLKKLDAGTRGCLTDATANVVKKIANDFPGDIGCFSPFIINHIILEPGQCCFYAAQEIHGYLSGECVECVACSNNTIRAACTPKFVDIDSLCKIINYEMRDPSYYIVPPTPLQNFEGITEFAPDCEDFTLHKIEVNRASMDIPTPIPCLDCNSIMVMVKGSAKIENLSERNISRKFVTVSKGDIFYIGARVQIRFVHCDEPVEAYRTFSYANGPDFTEQQHLHSIEEIRKKFKVQRERRGRYLIQQDGDDAEEFDVQEDLDGLC